MSGVGVFLIKSTYARVMLTDLHTGCTVIH